MSLNNLEDHIVATSKDSNINIYNEFFDNFANTKNNKYIFLNKLKSNGKTKYKRYLGTPLRYAGGKSLATGL